MAELRKSSKDWLWGCGAYGILVVRSKMAEPFCRGSVSGKNLEGGLSKEGSMDERIGRRCSL